MATPPKNDLRPRSVDLQKGRDPAVGAVLLGVGGLALLVVALVKLGGWYDGWQQLAQIDPAMAQRTMLRAVRHGMSVASVLVALVGAGVGTLGWLTVRAGQFPPGRTPTPSVVGDEARRFGAMLAALAIVGTVGAIAATWLVGKRLAASAVASQLSGVQRTARENTRPYHVASPKPRRAAALDPAQAQLDELRQLILLECAAGDRDLCTDAKKSKIRGWLDGRLRDGATCASLASELAVPADGIQPWCTQIAARLRPPDR